MTARIFKPAKTAMQSGEARTKEWVLEFEPAAPRDIDPLMGWTSSRDMQTQVRARVRYEGRGDLLRDTRRARLYAHRAETSQANPEVLRRQLPIRPDDELDALIFGAAGSPAGSRLPARAR